MNDKPYCCVMDCPNDGEFDIWGRAGPEDNTQACREHVGELLGSPAYATEENRVWRVTMLDLTQSPVLYGEGPAYKS